MDVQNGVILLNLTVSLSILSVFLDSDQAASNSKSCCTRFPVAQADTHHTRRLTNGSSAPVATCGASLIQKTWCVLRFWPRSGASCVPVCEIFFWGFNHFSIHRWGRSAIHDSQQPTSPAGFLFRATALGGTIGKNDIIVYDIYIYIIYIYIYYIYIYIIYIYTYVVVHTNSTFCHILSLGGAAANFQYCSDRSSN